MNRRYVLYCVLTCAILGCSFTVSRSIVDYPILTGQALRYGLAAVALFALPAGQKSKPTVRDLARLALVAATGLVTFNVLLLFALRHADPAVIGTIVGASPLLLVLLGARKIQGRLVVAAGIVVAGAALVSGFGTHDPAGLVAAAGVLGCEAAFSLLAAPLLPRLGAVRVSAWSTALAVPLLLVALPLTGERPRLPTAGEAAAIAFLGLVLTVVAFVCWYTGVAGLGVDRAGLFVALVPVFALLTTAVVDHRLPAAAKVAGVLLVAAGLVVGAGRVKQDGWNAPHSSSAPAGSPASPGSSASSSACTTGASTSAAPT